MSEKIITCTRKVPECKGYKMENPAWGSTDFSCGYKKSGLIDCDDCICFTATKYNDFTGFDPRTGRKFVRTYTRKIRVKEDKQLRLPC